MTYFNTGQLNLNLRVEILIVFGFSNRVGSPMNDLNEALADVVTTSSIVSFLTYHSTIPQLLAFIERVSHLNCSLKTPSTSRLSQIASDVFGEVLQFVTMKRALSSTSIQQIHVKRAELTLKFLFTVQQHHKETLDKPFHSLMMNAVVQVIIKMKIETTNQAGCILVQVHQAPNIYSAG